MARKKRYSAAVFIKAIPGTGGIISTIASRVGCTWVTAKKALTERPTVNEAWRQEKERVKDMAESAIIAAMNAGDLQTIKWYLAKMAADRGYGEELEVKGPGTGGEFIIRVVRED